MKTLLRWLARRCDIHDRALPPLALAKLEEAAGIPGAVAQVWATTDGLPSHYDPDLLDCGRSWCRRRCQEAETGKWEREKRESAA